MDRNLELKQLDMNQLDALFNQGQPFIQLIKSTNPFGIRISADEMRQLQHLINDQDTLARSLRQAMDLLMRRDIIPPGQDNGVLAKVDSRQLAGVLHFFMRKQFVRIEPADKGEAVFIFDLPLLRQYWAHLHGLQPITGRVEELPDDYEEEEDKPEVPVPVLSESESDDEIVVVVPVVVPLPAEPVAVAEGSALKIESSATSNTASVALLVGIALALL